MTPPQATSFGERLRWHRERAGLSQEELAERAGVTASAISALERGARRRPYPHTVRRLAEALELAPGEQATFVSAAPRRNGAQDGAASLPTAGPLPSNPAGVRLAAQPEGLGTPGRGVPMQRTTLIGRTRESTALAELLRDHETCLLTLTGVGGCGKTRLAFHVAGEVRDAFPDGVWVVELASVVDPALVVQVIAATLGLQEAADVPLLDRLTAVLTSRSLLLVLDNCEHLLDACAQLADRLLAMCPNVRILVTSRESFQIAGERQWRVLPLAAPDADQPASLEDVARYPSVELFVARAQAVAPGFRLTATNAATVAQICARLAGIPLALELAAARVRVLGVEQIAERLDDALRLLTGGSRAAPTRQQTLRATLDWSYALLTEGERAVFRRLTVFAGGCDLAAAEAVCGEEDVLDILARLADKSLLQVDDDGGIARYRLLEPVRQHAAQHLAASGDAEAAGTRHAAYYLDLAERAEPELRGPNQVAWLERLDREQGNLRVALHWTQAHDGAEAGLRLAGALVGFWEGRGYLSEGRRWLTTMLALSPTTTPSRARVKALLGAGHVTQWQADLDAADAVLGESLAMARALDDKHLIAESLAWLGSIEMRRAAAAQAVALLEESLALFRDEGDEHGIAFGLLVLGVVIGNDGDPGRAVVLLDESVSLFRQFGDVRYTAIALSMQGAMTRGQGDLGKATVLLREALAGHRAVGDRAFLAENLMQLAGVAVARGQMLRSARLLGATETVRSTLGVALAPTNGRTQESFVTAIRAQLAEAEFTAAWTAGRAMTLEEAVAEAMASPRPAPSSPARVAPSPSEASPTTLTRREADVARLVAQEYTDREIAAALGITAGTAGIHVHHILVKLGVRSRWQIADWALGHGLAD